MLPRRELSYSERKINSVSLHFSDSVISAVRRVGVSCVLVCIASVAEVGYVGGLPAVVGMRVEDVGVVVSVL